MGNKFLEKIAGTGTSIWMHGASKAERKLAAANDKEGPKKSFAADYKRDNIAVSRATGRGVLTAAVGGVAVAHGATALANRAIKRGATTLSRGKTFVTGMSAIGAGAGYLGGVAKSFHNQGKEMNKKYQEKSAALNMLMDQGVDFETAAELVMEKAAIFGTVGGAIASTKDHRWGGAGMGFLGDVAGTAVSHHLGAGNAAHVVGAVVGTLAGHKYGKKARRDDILNKINKSED